MFIYSHSNLHKYPNGHGPQSSCLNRSTGELPEFTKSQMRRPTTSSAMPEGDVRGAVRESSPMESAPAGSTRLVDDSASRRSEAGPGAVEGACSRTAGVQKLASSVEVRECRSSFHCVSRLRRCVYALPYLGDCDLSFALPQFPAHVQEWQGPEG